jgi:hypothetical protein
MKTLKKTRPLNAACTSCGQMISSRAAGHAARICLICYARLLHDYFQKGRIEKSLDNGPSK